MTTEPPLRADARRNREKILAAARELFREQGTAVPLEDVARLAGVGIGTLYRRFPDREALVRQVVVDGFEICLAAVEAARDELDDPVAALGRLFGRVVEQREHLVLPLIGGPLVPDGRIRELQRAIRAGLGEILEAGRNAKVLRADVTPEDLIAVAAMACRPMPHLPAGAGAALAARQLAVYLHGLRPEGALPLPGAPLSPGDFGSSLAMD